MAETNNMGLPEQTPAAPPAAPAAPQAPPMQTPAPSSSGSQSLQGILKSLNWTEIAFGVLGAAALFYSIHYFSYNMNANKSFQTQVQNKIDDLNIKLQDIESVVNKTQTQTQSLDGGWY